jgi:hypothetical protein
MKTISCNKVKKLIGSYSQDLLTPDWAERVNDHLANCSDCEKEYQKTRGVLDLLKQDRLPDQGAEFWEGMNTRIMSQIRQVRSEPERIPWTKKIWGYPFGWPGYAWATALILLILTPVLLYTIHFNNQPPSPVQEWVATDLRWEMGTESLPTILEALSPKESSRLGKKIVARLSSDLPIQTPLMAEDELQGDLSHSLEGLDKEELDSLIKKIQTGGSAGLKEDERYVT